MVETLRQQHQELLRLIKQIDATVEHGEESEMLAALSSLAEPLLDHVALEDQELYFDLGCAAESSGDDTMLETVFRFFSDKQRIVESLKRLMSQHKADFHLERFQLRWNTLSAVLTRHIESEERTLYPLYERCISTQALH